MELSLLLWVKCICNKPKQMRKESNVKNIQISEIKDFPCIPTSVLVNFLWIMFAILDIKPTHLHITKHLLH